MTQYRAFIQTADGLGAVARELAAAEASLDALLQDAPALEAAAEGFTKTAAALLAARARNKQLHSAPLLQRGRAADAIDVIFLVPNALISLTSSLG